MRFLNEARYPPSAGISRFRFNGSWDATPTSQPLGSPGMEGRLGGVAGAVEGLATIRLPNLYYRHNTAIC